VPQIILTDGRYELGTFDIEGGSTIIGRSSNADIPLDDMTVSRRHAEIRCTGSSYFISSLGGRNGVFVNGNWIETVQLKHGDLIEIARYKMKFEVPVETTPGVEDSFRITGDQIARAAGNRESTDSLVAGWERERQQRNRGKLNSQQETFALKPVEMEQARTRLSMVQNAQLKATTPEGVKTYYLESTHTRIGKDEGCQIRIPGGWRAPKVAAEIEYRAEHYFICPVDGEVKLNGMVIKGPVPLQDELVIDVAGNRFKFLDEKKI